MMRYLRVEVEHGELIVQIGAFSLETSARGLGSFIRLTASDRVVRISGSEYKRVASILLGEGDD